MNLSFSALLPDDAAAALLVGRLWDPETAGPRPVLVDGDTLEKVGFIPAVK